MITKEEMLDFYKVNLQKTLINQEKDVQRLIMSHVEKSFENNGFELLMKVIEERLSRNQEIFLFRWEKDINLQISLSIYDGDYIAGVMAFTKEGADFIMQKHMHDVAFMDGVFKTVLNKDSTKEEIMNALYYSNYLGLSFYAFNKIDLLVGDFNQKEMKLVDKYLKVFHKKYQLYDECFVNINKLNKMGVLLIRKCEAIKSNYLEFDSYKSNYIHTKQFENELNNGKKLELNPIEMFADKLGFEYDYNISVAENVLKNKEILEKEDKLEKVFYALSQIRFREIIKEINNRKINWVTGKEIDVLTYLDMFSEMRRYGFFHKDSCRKDVEFVINDYLENGLKTTPLAYKCLMATNILNISKNIKNNRTINKRVVESLELAMKNEICERVDVIDKNISNVFHENIINNWVELLSPKNKVFIIREIDIRFALLNFNESLSDIKRFSTPSCQIYDKGRNFVIEHKYHMISDQNMEKIILDFLVQQEKNNGVNLDMKIREYLLKNKLEEKETLVSIKKKL